MSIPLSEAIRLGAILRPQTNGQLFWDGGSCALGAAAEAVGLSTAEIDSVDDPDDGDHDFRYDELRALFPILGVEAMDPATEADPMELLTLISVLNDRHVWTREQIADFVATIEAQQAQPEALAEEVVSVS